jgi:hypothetical protein
MLLLRKNLKSQVRHVEKFCFFVGELCEMKGVETFKDIHDRISKARNENLELSDTSQWHSFEDHLLVQFPDSMSQHDNKIKNM